MMRDAAFEDRGRLAVSPASAQDSPNRSAAHSEDPLAFAPRGGGSFVMCGTRRTRPVEKERTHDPHEPHRLALAPRRARCSRRRCAARPRRLRAPGRPRRPSPPRRPHRSPRSRSPSPTTRAASVTIDAEPAAHRLARAGQHRDRSSRSALGDKVVGVTTYDDYPAEVADIAKVGDFTDAQLRGDRRRQARPRARDDRRAGRRRSRSSRSSAPRSSPSTRRTLDGRLRRHRARRAGDRHDAQGARRLVTGT